MAYTGWSTLPWLPLLLTVSLTTFTGCPDGPSDDDDATTPPATTAPGDDDDASGDDDDDTTGDDDDDATGDDDDDATTGDDDDDATTGDDDDDATSGDDDDDATTAGDDDDATSGDDDDATAGDDDDATSGDDDDATAGDDDDATAGDDDDTTAGDDDDASSSPEDADEDGFTLEEGDCNDHDATVHPGAAELCDGLDQDCDGVSDDGLDGDGDGALPCAVDGEPADCDDGDSSIHPDAAEVCDGIDQDCDGVADDGVTSPYYPDADDDGYGNPQGVTQACTAPTGFVPTAGDCADDDPAISPAATEVCDGKDNDCDGQVDESGDLLFYRDADDDGFGDPAGGLSLCAAPAGYVEDGTDCDDTDPSTHPSAGEIPGDGIDQDCDGQDLPIVDLNRDGFPDMVVANFYSSTKSSYEIDSYVYWGSATGMNAANRALFPTLGASGTCVGDLNGDGWPELVFANYRNNSTRSVKSYVYWGQAGGPVPTNRLELPTIGTTECAIGDLNGDGRPDLAFSGYNHTSWSATTYVYYNSQTGFDAARRTALDAKGNWAVLVIDVNDDGYDDLFQLNSYGETGGNKQNSYLFWGSKDGIATDRKVTFATLGPLYDPVVADFNRDGYQDFAISNQVDGTNYNVKSTVHWGSKDGFLTKTELPVQGGTTVRAADLDRDGWLDLVFGSSFVGSGARSYLYWGSPEGFNASDVLLIPTTYVHDLLVLDLDHDGWQDLIFAQRSNGSTFRTDSYIYMNGPAGITVNDRYAVPTNGTLDAAAADMNLDGVVDVMFSGYYNDVSYDSDGYVYYGSGGGYASNDRTALPMSGGYTVDVVGYLD